MLDEKKFVKHSDNLSLGALFKNALHYKKLFILTFVMIFGVVIIYVLFAPPIYKSDVLIQVEDKKSSALGSALQNISPALDSQSSPISGEIEIFKSRTVIGRAVQSLFLNTKISIGNRFPIIGNIIYRFLEKDSSGLAKSPFGWNGYAWGGEDLIFDSFNIPKSYQNKELMLIVKTNDSWDLLDDDDNLLAYGYVGTTSESKDGFWQINIKKIQANPGTKFILKQSSVQSSIDQITSRLTAKETGKQSGLFRVEFEDGNSNFAKRLLNSIANSYVDQNTERKAEEASKTLRFLENKLPELKDGMILAEKKFSEYRNREKTIDVPGEIKSLLEQAVNLETQRIQLEIKLSENLLRYQPAHPYIKSLKNQIKQVKSESLYLDSQISELPETQREYMSLARDAEISTRLYTSLLDTSQQLQVTKAGTVGNVTIIDSAIAPEYPSKPNRILLVSLGGFFAIFLGLLFTNIFSILKAVIRSPKSIESFGYNILGVIQESNLQKECTLDDKNHILIEKFPNSPDSESFRSLAFSLSIFNKTKSSKTFLVTSAIPSQGKSFICSNLSFSLSATNKRVLLIDFDVRRSTLLNYFNIKANVGVTDILERGVSVDDCIIKNYINNLDFLPAGRQLKNPSIYFNDVTIKKFFNSLQLEYDFIIIDSPPVLPVNDSLVLANYVDSLIFVVRQDKVSLNELTKSLSLLNVYNQKILGFVYNGYCELMDSYGIYNGSRYSYYGKYNYNSIPNKSPYKFKKLLIILYSNLKSKILNIVKIFNK